jgi:hypothetical protein
MQVVPHLVDFDDRYRFGFRLRAGMINIAANPAHTDCAQLPSRWPTALRDRPKPYSVTAACFTSSGVP